MEDAYKAYLADIPKESTRYFPPPRKNTGRETWRCGPEFTNRLSRLLEKNVIGADGLVRYVFFWKPSYMGGVGATFKTVISKHGMFTENRLDKDEMQFFQWAYDNNIPVLCTWSLTNHLAEGSSHIIAFILRHDHIYLLETYFTFGNKFPFDMQSSLLRSLELQNTEGLEPHPLGERDFEFHQPVLKSSTEVYDLQRKNTEFGSGYCPMWAGIFLLKASQFDFKGDLEAQIKSVYEELDAALSTKEGIYQLFSTFYGREGGRQKNKSRKQKSKRKTRRHR